MRTSRGLKWENKMYKLKRSIGRPFRFFFRGFEPRFCVHRFKCARPAKSFYLLFLTQPIFLLLITLRILYNALPNL